MKNILFITHHYLNGNGGGCYASRAFINAFAKDNNLTLLFPMKQGATPKELAENIKQIPVWNNKTKIRKCLDLLFGNIHRYNNIRNYIYDAQFDIVVFDTSLVSYKLIDFFHKKGSKVICIHHNYQYEYFKDNFNGIIKYINLYWCKRYEKEAVQKSDINLTLTDQDSLLLSQHYGRGNEKFHNIGIFEYMNDKKAIPNTSNNNTVLPIFIITGSLGDAQTEKSIKIWIEQYYAILKQEFTEHKIIIAGKNPSYQLYKVCQLYKNIEIIANPKTMDEILRLGTYFLCPVEFGGGIKLRIMDGLKYGMQVITHIVSARGYDLFEQKGYVHSYSTPFEFQKCLKELTHKNISRNEICDFYRRNYSLEMGIKKINQIINSLE